MANIVLAKDVIIIHPRELEISKMVAKGKGNKDISTELKISKRTVQSILCRVFKKLNIKTRSEILPILLKNGLITTEEL
jgi:DNA-binding CsgD family transcriptional regulator